MGGIVYLGVLTFCVVVISGSLIRLREGFWGTIPAEYISRGRKYTPAPTIAHGQAPVWGSGNVGLQGVSELTECKRCDDKWLQEVQKGFRYGMLSENSHAFLHGQHTTVPGS